MKTQSTLNRIEISLAPGFVFPEGDGGCDNVTFQNRWVEACLDRTPKRPKRAKRITKTSEQKPGLGI